MPDSTPRPSVAIAACKVPGHALASVPVPGAPLGRYHFSPPAAARWAGCSDAGLTLGALSLAPSKRASMGVPSPPGTGLTLPYLGDRHVRPGCRRLRDPLPGSPAPIGNLHGSVPGAIPGGRLRWRRDCPTACAPAGLHPPHALPSARVMREPPAHWLGRARPPERSPARWPLPCGRGGLRSRGRWAADGHVTPAVLASPGDLCGEVC